ncbi:SRPBCC family protein [Kitasatospora sp. NPDC002227]|uniref:SRPBCC family protein n=1 Tax=Kitasatospora sp. NPDC002227 TaxID=3154773 RepID=UPI00333058FB
MNGRLSGLLRVGPSLATLDRDYARAGRVDSAAPVQARHQVAVAAPPGQVFALITDFAGWAGWFPAVSGIEVTPGPVQPGTQFRWRSGKDRIRSTVATLIPGQEISWTGVCSGARAVRRHLLAQAADGGTVLTVEESMSGLLLTLFYDSDRLQQATGAWLEALRTTAERGWRDGLQPGQSGSSIPA